MKIDLCSLMPKTVEFSSRLARETILIGASLFFAMMKEQCGFSFMNWNLRYATTPYALSEAISEAV